MNQIIQVTKKTNLKTLSQKQLFQHFNKLIQEQFYELGN